MAMKPIEILINAKDNASSVFDGLKTKLTAVGAAVAAYFGVSAFVGAVKGAADFEAGMSRVKAATGASAEEMARLKKAAEDAGANTKFTSTQAASALENLAKAGLSAKDAIAALPAVLNLAQAGDIELGTASEYLTKAVMGMGLAFTDAGRVADVLALGANATNTSVTGLAQALSYVAPIANTLGVSLESTVAIIGKFADAGIDASRAGTALNSIMSQFADPASKFRQELGAAGITTNNFEAALHQLAQAGPGGAKAINAVGLEAGPALRALLNQGMGALDELTKKLKSAEGSAAATAKVMQDNLNGSLGGLASAWDTVKNVLGTPVLPVIKDGVDQLAAALKSAVSDGTIQKFGEAIATSFQAAIKWVREFLQQVDFTQVTANMRAFVDRAGEVFTQIGEYATNAGNIVKLAYGVMSAGTNVVLTAIYGIGYGFAEVASTVMAGVAKLRDGLASVTFGGLADSFKLAAEDARNAAQGFGEAAQAMRDAASKAMQDTANSAQLARDGFAGLAKAATDTRPAVNAAAQALDDMGTKLEETRQKSQAAQKATDDKKASDVAATVALQALRAEYQTLVSSGNLQAAAEKLGEINKAMQATPAAAKDAVKAAQEAAQAIADAFQRMGITSSADLKRQAENSLRDYNIIKGAGTSTAEDIANAFKKSAEDAIAANKGIAPSWVTAQAAAKGFTLEVDETGKTILKATNAMRDLGSASGATGQAMSKAMGEGGAAVAYTTEQLKAQAAAIDAINGKYGQSKKDREGKYDAPKGDSVVPTSGGDREKFLAGQNAVDNTLQFELLRKSQTGALSAADVADAKRYLEAQKQQNQINRDLDKFGNGFSTAGALDRAKWERFQSVMQNFVDSQENNPPAGAGAAQERSPAPSAPTYVTNITIDGAPRAVRTSDAQSQSTVNDLVRQLAAARGSAIR